MGCIDSYAADIRAAVSVLRQGGVILYPTDTIWGIGCDATNAAAVARVYAIKERQESKALICLTDSERHLLRYASRLDAVAWDVLTLATSPTTVIVDGITGLAPNVYAADGSVALRLTREAFSQQLCYTFERPLVSTSANVAGQPTPATFGDIAPALKAAVDYVCLSRREERTPHKPSRIIRLDKDNGITILR